MLTDVQLINKGLSKIASNRVNSISPPRTQLEVFMAGNYKQWIREELTKRRWVFAMEEDYQLTYSEKLEGVDRPYKYVLPVNCLRVIRTRKTEWKQVGRTIRSNDAKLKIDYIRNVLESDFDALFNEVAACRIAVESCEFVTQSTAKKQLAMQDYKDAVATAGQMNAFTIGPEPVTEDERAYGWEVARHG